MTLVVPSVTPVKIAQNRHLLTAGRGIDAHYLSVAPEFVDRDLQRHQVDIETAL